MWKTKPRWDSNQRRDVHAVCADVGEPACKLRSHSATRSAAGGPVQAASQHQVRQRVSVARAGRKVPEANVRKRSSVSLR